VPYNEGGNLITKINGKCSMEHLKSWIKEAQQYSVNLYENDMRKIGNGIYPLLNGGILAVRKEFYDDNLGVITEGKPQDFLSI
jgi:CRISPR-associated endonuclease/helicase Cas3